MGGACGEHEEEERKKEISEKIHRFIVVPKLPFFKKQADPNKHEEDMG
jgi:hypothetical protein